jgi:hypothetical protein
MKSFRKFAYTGVLTLGALSLIPSPASAQTANGSFTLSHDVHWQNAVVPAGTYKFSLEPKGPSGLLTLRNIGGAREGFIILVNNIGPSRPSDLDQLVLVSRGRKSFVRTLELPNFEMTLQFGVPPESTAKELALAGDNSGPTPTR